MHRRRRIDAVSARMRRTADGPLGPLVIGAWAVAEAFAFPLIPDSGLAGMAFASPRRARRLWVACLLGTVLGSMAAVWLARQGLAWPLPLVTERMATTATGWIATDGAAALARGSRMAVTAALGAPAGRARDRWVPARHRATVHVGVVAVATVGLLGTLAVIVAAWR